MKICSVEVFFFTVDIYLHLAFIQSDLHSIPHIFHQFMYFASTLALLLTCYTVELQDVQLLIKVMVTPVL